MRVLVSGAGGFVGRWLSEELAAHGHRVVGLPGHALLDIADRDGLQTALGRVGVVDAVAHLAGMAYAPDAASDPGEAFRVNVGGTVAILEGLRGVGLRPAVLVVGSSEVYGRPRAEDLPLTETAPLNPLHPYAYSKAAAEALSLELARRDGLPLVVARSFNHTGPRQRPVFVVPALAQRVDLVRRGRAHLVVAGNLDVRRDITDVRDVVRAYRLLLEWMTSWRAASPPVVVNVASGQSVSIRTIAETLCRLAGVDPPIVSDPALIRARDAPDIRGDIALLQDATGWRPTIALEQTLADVLAAGRDLPEP